MGNRTRASGITRPGRPSVIDVLTARFPHHTPQTVAETVYTTHARLRENATVTTHLAALTQRQADDELARTLPRRRAQQAEPGDAAANV